MSLCCFPLSMYSSGTCSVRYYDALLLGTNVLNNISSIFPIKEDILEVPEEIAFGPSAFLAGELIA